MSAEQLLAEAYQLPYNERKEQMLRAADLAAAENDLDIEYRARMAVVSGSHNDPDMQASITNYGWCLARHDEDPERFPVRLWYYKWIVNAAPKYPTVSRGQLSGLVEDLDRRFTAENASPAAVVKLRTVTALYLGDVDATATLHEEWRSISEGKGWGRQNDCSACEVAHEIGISAFLGDHQRAVEEGERMIEGNMACASEPHHAFGDFLDAARPLGRDDLADEALERGRSLIGEDPSFQLAAGSYLRHMALTGRADEARQWIERLGPPDGDPWGQLQYGRGIRLVALANDEPEPADVGPLAAAFDERNGNDRVSCWLAEDLAELHAVS